MPSRSRSGPPNPGCTTPSKRSELPWRPHARGTDGMNANDNLERGIADVYHAEAPHRAPDWVLANALETIESTPQRRVLIRVPWRFPDMNNTFAKVAIAAVAVLAIGVVGLNLLRPSASSGVGAQ